MNTIQSSIVQYWDRRAASYTDVIQQNLSGKWENVWADELISHFPDKEDIKVLDIGTGPGFYAIILAKRGYNVIAVDYSEGMLCEARNNAGPLADNIRFLRMDAQNLEFEDNSFDVIVTRNLTWNLPDPVKAYSEWYRVLKDDGVMLNFDANWYAYLFDEDKKDAYIQDRANVKEAGMSDHEGYEEADKMERISRDLPMGKIARPAWDIAVLLSKGFRNVHADTSIGDRVWNPEEKLNYASTPGFLITAVK